MFAKLVVPTIGAVTPGLDSTHASATCAMLAPLRFASSSTLCDRFDVRALDGQKKKGGVPRTDHGHDVILVSEHHSVRRVLPDGPREQPSAERGPRNRADAKHLAIKLS